MVCIIPPKRGNWVGFPLKLDVCKVFLTYINKISIKDFFFFFFFWTYAVSSLIDEHHTAPNKNFVNFPELNRILRSEIFLHKDG